MNIPFIVISVSLLMATLLAVLLRKRNWPKSRLILLLSVVSVSLGIWLVVWSSGQIVSARLIKQWPTVAGTIVQSKIVGDRAIRPLVFYQYQIGDMSYRDSSSLGVPSFGNRRIRMNESKTISAEYRVGDTVMVYYNPATPGHSMLYAREEWSSYVRLSLGALLIVAGFFVMGRFLLGYLMKK